MIEDEIDLCGCRWSLQLLAVQHLFLQLLDGLSKGGNMTCMSVKNMVGALITSFHCSHSPGQNTFQSNLFFMFHLFFKSIILRLDHRLNRTHFWMDNLKWICIEEI